MQAFNGIIWQLPLFVRFFAWCRKLQIYTHLVHIKNFPISADREVEKRIPTKRCEKINPEDKDRTDFRMKNLELFYRDVRVPAMEVASWLKAVNGVLLICQWIRPFDRRQIVLQWITPSESFVVFLTEIWLSNEMHKSEVFLA